MTGKTVVIFGAGATIGSGYTRCENKLPGDQGFFGHPEVQVSLTNGKYFALDIMLNMFRNIYGGALTNVSLEEVWTFLEFSGKDMYKTLTDLVEERKKWLEKIRKPDSKADDEHCLCQRYREDRTIPVPNDVDLHLLAGWDLRRLLCHVYSEVVPPKTNIYELLIEEYELAKTSSTTFISLNYDTILEKELNRASVHWHYLHVPTKEPRDESGIPILKPHGSFNWLFNGNEPSVSISTDYRDDPVTQNSYEVNRFKEVMIIPPTQLKQAINIRETQPKEITDLFTKTFQGMAEALVDASRVFIIGYSFPSTDHHLRTLFHQVSHKRRDTKYYDEVYCCTLANGWQEGMVFANANRFFPAKCFHLHDRGFEDFVSPKQNIT